MKCAKLIVIAMMIYINAYLLCHIQYISERIGLFGIVLFAIAIIIGGSYLIYLLDLFKTPKK